MIAGFCEGRVRLRHPALKNAETAAALVARLGEYPGVLKISANPLTGSALMLYDPALVSREDLIEAAALGEQPGAAPNDCRNAGGLRSLLCAVPEKYEIGLLNASFAVCLLGLLGPRRLHSWAGGVFAALVGLHVSRRREKR